MCSYCINPTLGEAVLSEKKIFEALPKIVTPFAPLPEPTTSWFAAALKLPGILFPMPTLDEESMYRAGVPEDVEASDGVIAKAFPTVPAVQL
jgi:hypothetical protein